MKKIKSIIFFFTITILSSCKIYNTKGVHFYNYSRNNDLWINVSAKLQSNDQFTNLTGGLCKHQETKPWCFSDLGDFGEWDEFLIVFSNASQTVIYKETIVSKRKLFKKWKGQINYGKANWKAFLSDEDYKRISGD